MLRRLRQSRGGNWVVEAKRDLFLEESVMLRMAILFLVIALVAGLLNFTGVEGVALDAARILFFVFIVLAVLSFLGGMFRTPPA